MLIQIAPGIAIAELMKACELIDCELVNARQGLVLVRTGDPVPEPPPPTSAKPQRAEPFAPCEVIALRRNPVGPKERKR